MLGVVGALMLSLIDHRRYETFTCPTCQAATINARYVELSLSVSMSTRSMPGILGLTQGRQLLFLTQNPLTDVETLKLAVPNARLVACRLESLW